MAQVEIAAWQKSSFSGGLDAPELPRARRPPETRTLLLRESDEPDAVIAATGVGLAALIRHVRERY
jgi:hypothetical protein